MERKKQRGSLRAAFKGSLPGGVEGRPMRPRILGLVGLVCCLSVTGQPKFEKKSLREEQKAIEDKPGYQLESDYPVLTAPISPTANE